MPLFPDVPGPLSGLGGQGSPEVLQPWGVVGGGVLAPSPLGDALCLARASFSPQEAGPVLQTTVQWLTTKHQVSAFTLEFCFLVVFSLRLLVSLLPQKKDLMCPSRPFKTAPTTCLRARLPEASERDPLVLVLR